MMTPVNNFLFVSLYIHRVQPPRFFFQEIGIVAQGAVGVWKVRMQVDGPDLRLIHSVPALTFSVTGVSA